ncbi:hypothetical protein A3B45_00565 [Candidatus Daviesbacteria bacterium RIFCSPLOWO2_01_FULL_39_12]|uniref:Uncharacterized protein n=1 Tax=Candidatus Daviesbacteria bacterium RIFCSPLOWO2_01_FULL_39_12 TaxID=1797785 RepID=A0A1F5KMG7_9BACT|nr:MAG: hypothetical protein A3D79_02280 [Candidatus Daviesbacteria bacterium RIFCSPHIGHO2_02_FULL_39_8]OGE42133.1 MAG: hypothetical protein A3B45_00565 [Candidatus Daviesbacteria bacterium RIFCSPLOWO2_01_FULL_39_12]
MKEVLKFSQKIRKFLNSLLLLFILVFILFVLTHLLLPLQLISVISDDFNKVAIGIAALVTAYFGSSYFREELSRKRAIEYYRKKYPPEKYQKTFKIIESEDGPGAVFLLDLESLHKHHIWNMKTMYDLGWQLYKRESLPNEKFLSYLIGDPIRTRGDLGE